MVPLDVREHREHPPAFDGQLIPSPFDEERYLRQIVFMRNGDHALYAMTLEEMAQSSDTRRSRAHDGIGNIQG